MKFYECENYISPRGVIWASNSKEAVRIYKKFIVGPNKLSKLKVHCHIFDVDLVLIDIMNAQWEEYKDDDEMVKRSKEILYEIVRKEEATEVICAGKTRLFE